ncbi:MAG: prepilin-type N-terminal cleavage/methylation domain-containing protein [Firmicutes bacterium]|nr:prepilin-type N-terminal cleavage/methylation domain-containing protein [Bacillota bacterium]
MKKKGFTLIELLAVIVILAIIALIAVPVIINIISSARESAFEDTAYGLISAGEMYYAQELLENGMTSDVEFTIEDGKFVGENKLEVKGALPTNGKIKVTRDGKVALAISNGTMCITKGYNDGKIDLEEDVDNCVLPTGEPQLGTLVYLVKTNDFATTINACATNGNECAPGTPFAIEVAPGEVKNFYVVSDVDNKVTLIMDRNIGNAVEWNTSGNNADGPITVLNYLESQTSNWTNIAAKDYTLTDSVYGTITRANARARMLTETEANAIIGYDWSYENLDEDVGPWGYWLSSAHTKLASDALSVGVYGDIDCGGIDAGNFGVRPVIEISKK